MSEECEPPPYCADMASDPPPPYSEAVAGVQPSPQHLLARQDMTQVMIEQQWNNLENNTANTDREQLIVPVQKKKHGQWIPIVFIVVIIKIIIIIAIMSSWH
eukprot:TRINITY_DN34296_c0_g1_i1.p1 TRINITY_DN34296_c0_g1~~TRINITY_DN34296_c0_g1_i1.p1  ORF type:complete len:102 (+),score=23.35 TRINITY_DN34296_c0_g1_i1:55-360(+)